MPNNQKELFKLDITLTLTKMLVDDRGHQQWTSDRMSVTDSFELGSMNLLEAMKIVGKMHTTITEVKESTERA